MSPPVISRRVRVSQMKGVVERVPRGRVPHVDLDLGENQTVVSMETNSLEFTARSRDRRTVDWRWTAWIATELGGVTELDGRRPPAEAETSEAAA